jgi:ankyrin repeat protein
VEELAEVLAVDFDNAEGIPKLNPNWRWEDEEQALLTSCSSLIAIVEANYSRVVQFSHFSVKEFLTSTRLANSSNNISRYHIDFEPAHTILAQACMGVLLQPDDCVEENSVGRSSSLAEYAARHWVTHAQFESVSLSLRKAMEYLFDLDKPYFAAWLELHNVDIRPREDDSSLYWVAPPSASTASPLYYAALCGFQGLVEHLVVKSPQHVNASGGYYMTPLVAALARGHFQTAKLLRHNGAHANVHGGQEYTPLHSAAHCGDLKIVQTLLDYEADVNAQCLYGYTPLYSVSIGLGPSSAVHSGTQSLPDVARLLVEHGIDVNGRSDDGRTPLHAAAGYGNVEVIRVLLEHDANIGAEDTEGRTPSHKAAEYGKVEAMRVLLEHDANVGREDKKGRTPLHAAALEGHVKLAGVLLEHGANVGAEDTEGRTPLHEAAEYRNVEVMRVLLEHDADVGAEDKKGESPFQIASLKGYRNIMKLLSDYGAKGMFSISTSSLCLPW